MFDRVFSAALAFCVLAAGTLAVGSALFEQPKAEAQVVYLPKVEVNGKRAVQVAMSETTPQHQQ
ncbi:hypothetical protein [Piscinibacter terrae]|uniref:Uncharacterized protein n=1 Tax=Piscinibacter terrae TaxID=2496871 RepID=A0A3N7HST9_9BURK|nr:hypothetical protein [Albitalea terrae]RQP24833.1 hypothetical protein DZC73_08125 [Albitalea terrae]